MPYFEDVKEELPKHVSLRLAIGGAVFAHARVTEVVQRKPWTMVKARVYFNGVKFEGVGFARQRQYTSLVVHRVHRFPWAKLVLAKRDDWDAQAGQCIATVRAVRNITTNVVRAYKRWVSGELAVETKESCVNGR